MNYEEVLEEINRDPETFIRERKLDKIAALKLQIPEAIRVQRQQRRFHWSSFDQAYREQKQREAEIAFAVKHEKDSITNKPKFHNKEARELEVRERIDKDSSWQRWEKQRSAMYATVKKIEEDIDYLERIDQSLIEVLAMFTAHIEYETRYSRGYGSKEPRSGKRAATRARMASKASIGTEDTTGSDTLTGSRDPSILPPSFRGTDQR